MSSGNLVSDEILNSIVSSRLVKEKNNGLSEEIFKNGKEIGRILERPSESIEEDFFQFVDKNK